MHHYCRAQLEHPHLFSHLKLVLFTHGNVAHVKSSYHSQVEIAVPVPSLQEDPLVLLVDLPSELLEGSQIHTHQGAIESVGIDHLEVRRAVEPMVVTWRQIEDYLIQVVARFALQGRNFISSESNGLPCHELPERILDVLHYHTLVGSHFRYRQDSAVRWNQQMLLISRNWTRLDVPSEKVPQGLEPLQGKHHIVEVNRVSAAICAIDPFSNCCWNLHVEELPVSLRHEFAHCWLHSDKPYLVRLVIVVDAQSIDQDDTAYQEHWSVQHVPYLRDNAYFRIPEASARAQMPGSYQSTRSLIQNADSPLRGR